MFRKIGKIFVLALFALALLPSGKANAISLTSIEPNFSDTEILQNNLPVPDGYDFNFTARENNQVVEYTATLINDEAYDIKIKNITLNSPENNFLEYSYSGIDVKDIIEVGEIKEIIVRVRLNDQETLTTTEDYKLDIDYDLLVPEDVVIDNTPTSDLIFGSIAVFIGAGIFVFIVFKNSTNRRGIYAIAFIALTSTILLANSAFAENAKTFTIHGKMNFINVYTVEIDPDGGIYDNKTTATTMRVDDGTKIHISEATRDTYNFVEWQMNRGQLDENNDIIISDDTYLKAIWDEVYYTLTIDPNGGKYKGVETEVKEKYRPGETANLETPTKTGCEFTNWTKGSSSYTNNTIVMNSDITLVANYEDLYFTVVINPNGGKFNGETVVYRDEHVKYGTEINITDIAWENHAFKSWTKDSTDTLPATTESITVISNITLDAVWNEIYILTIDPNGGTYNENAEIQNFEVENGESFSLLRPKRDEYAFLNWLKNDTDNYSGNSIIITSDTTLQAQWSLAVAMIERTGELYPSIMAAHDDANPEGETPENGDKIILLRDTEEVATNTKKVTLDLNQHTVTGSLTNTPSGDITLINGEINNPDGAAVTNNGVLTMGINDYKADGTVNILNENIRLIGTNIGLKQNATFNFYDGFIEGIVGLDGGYNDSPFYRETFPERIVKYFPFVSHNNIKDCQHVQLENSDRAVSKTADNGEIYYYNLQDNVNASAVTGYKMYAVRDFDASYPITIASGDEIEFDLAGYHPNMADVWTNNGTITISDSGDKTTEEKGYINFTKSFMNNSTLNVTGATLSSNTDNAAVLNKGAITMTGGTISSSVCYALEVMQNGTTLTMDENSYIRGTSTSCYALYNKSSDLVISNGHILGEKYGAVYNENAMSVTGGEIKTVACSNYAISNTQRASVTITGGKVVAETNCSDRNTTGISGGYIYLRDSGEIIAKNSRIGGQNDSIMGVTGYLTMSGGEIYVETHNTGSKAIGLSAYGNSTFPNRFNLTGGKITARAFDGNNASAIGINCEYYCSGTTENITIDAYSENGTALGAENDWSQATIGTGTEISAKTKNGKAIGLGNYLTDSSNMIISGATINATIEEGGTSTEAYGIYGPSSNYFEVKDETEIYGQTVGIKSADAVVKSGKTKGGQYGIDGGSYTIGVLDDTINSTNPEIEGGIYGIKSGSYNFYDGILKGGQNAHENRDVIKAIPDGADYHLEEKTEGKDTEDLWLVEGENFLEVNGEELNSFTKAYNKASNGDTVKVIADKTTNGVNPANKKNITLDLNNYTLTLAQTLPNEGTLTITDNSDEKGGKIINTGNKPILTNGGTLLKIDGGTFEANSTTAIQNNYSKKLEMNGGTIRNKTNGKNAYVFNCGEYSVTTINGGTIEAEDTANGAITIFYGGNAKIYGGTITAKATNGSATAFSNTYTNIFGGTISVESVNYKAYGNYTNNFYQDGGKLIVKGATEANGLYRSWGVPENTWTLAGGEIEVSANGPAYGFINNSSTLKEQGKLTVTSLNDNAYGVAGDGSIVMSDGTITVHRSNSSKTAIGINQSGSTIKGGKIEADTYGISRSGSYYIGTTTEPLEIANPEIYGGSKGVNEGNIYFYGGIFKGGEQAYNSLDQFKEIPDGATYHHEPKTESHETDDLWLVADDPFLEVNGEPLNSFTKAYNKVADNGTIKVIADKTTEAYIPANPQGRTVTLDLNGHSLNFSRTLTNKGTMYITDNKDGSGSINNRSTGQTPAINNEGTLTVEKGKITSHFKAIQNTSSTVTLKGTSEVEVTRGSYSGQIYGVQGSNGVLNIEDNAKITVSGESGYMTAVSTGTTYLKGGSVLVTSTGNYEIAGISGSLNMTGGELNVIARGGGKAKAQGGGLNISISAGEVYVATESSFAVGLDYDENGTATLSGTGKLTVESKTGNATGIDSERLKIYLKDDFELKATTKSGIAAGITKDNSSGAVLHMTGGSIVSESETGNSYGTIITYARIRGGNITAGTYGVYTTDEYNTIDDVVIGTKDGNLDTTSPTIRGGVYAIKGDNVYFYDGILYGGSAAIEDMQYVKEIETDTYVYNTNETIDEVTYEKRYLVPEHEVAQITRNGVTTRYNSIKKAIAGSEAGDTIELIEDNYAFSGFTVPSEKDVKIELAGFNIISSGPIINQGKLEFLNNGTDVELSYAGSNYFMQNAESATLKLDSVKIKANKAISNAANASLVIDGSELTQGTNGAGSFILNSSGELLVENSAKINAISTAISGTGNITIKTDSEIIGRDTAVWFNGAKLTVDNATINSNSYSIYINNTTEKSAITDAKLNNRIYIGEGEVDLIRNEVISQNVSYDTKLVEISSSAKASIQGGEYSLTPRGNNNNNFSSTIKNSGELTIVDSEVKINTMNYIYSSNNYAVYSNGTTGITNTNISTTGGDSNSGTKKVGIYVSGGQTTYHSGEVNINAPIAYGVYITSGGEFTLGDEEPTTSVDYGKNVANKTNPSIKAIGSSGTGVGLYNGNRFNYYDGKILGNTQSMSPLVPTNIEYLYEVDERTDENGYKYTFLRHMYLD